MPVNLQPISFTSCYVNPSGYSLPFYSVGYRHFGSFSFDDRASPIYYFKKWVEAELVASITARRVKQFLWKNVVYQFGVPRVLISDNDTQFIDWSVQELGIRHHFTSVAHPQANGQIELANRTLLDGLKVHVDKADGSWVDELPSILWSYRTMVKVSMSETPFSLCYGSEALIPVEIRVPTFRVELFSPESNEQNLRNTLDLLDELRDQVKVWQTTYNRCIERYYNWRVKA